MFSIGLSKGFLLDQFCLLPAEKVCITDAVSSLHSLASKSPEAPGSLHDCITFQSISATAKIAKPFSLPSNSFPSPSPAGLCAACLFSPRLRPLLQRWLCYSDEIIEGGMISIIYHFAKIEMFCLKFSKLHANLRMDFELSKNSTIISENIHDFCY